MPRTRLILALVLLAPLAAASHAVDVGTEATCPRVLLAEACAVRQSGVLSIACSEGCDLVLQGWAEATDGAPLKRVRAHMDVPLVGSAIDECVGLGLGTTRCQVDMRFPFVVAPGACWRVTVGTDYERPPYGTVRIARAFLACADADGGHSLSPA